MMVRVQYMAQLRTLAGVGEEPVELPESSHVMALVEQLARERVEAASHLLADDKHLRPSLLIAVNGAAVAARDAVNTVLRQGDVVTLLPPIAGG